MLIQSLYELGAAPEFWKEQAGAVKDMKKLFSPRYLYVLAVLVWLGVVLLYATPIEDGRKNSVASLIFILGLGILAFVRILWRLLTRHKDPWSE